MTKREIEKLLKKADFHKHSGRKHGILLRDF
jgi:hypothetical protein